jgi:hypothetical protein
MNMNTMGDVICRYDDSYSDDGGPVMPQKWQ